MKSASGPMPTGWARRPRTTMSKIFPELKKLDRFTSLGSYPLVYFMKVWSWHGQEECIEVCCECADKFVMMKEWEGGGDREFKIDDIIPQVYYEGPPLTCEECGETIESAYGDPNAEAHD
jgi:hypothetical protein